MPITNFVGFPGLRIHRVGHDPGHHRPTNPTPMTTTISLPISRCLFTRVFRRKNSGDTRFPSGAGIDFRGAYGTGFFGRFFLF